MQHLRFDDKDTRAERVKTDKFAAISDIWTRFNENCAESFTPGKRMTIDQQLFPNKCCSWAVKCCGSVPTVARENITSVTSCKVAQTKKFLNVPLGSLRESCSEGEEENHQTSWKLKQELKDSLVDMYKANPKVNEELKQRLPSPIKRHCSETTPQTGFCGEVTQPDIAQAALETAAPEKKLK
ncbi:mirror-image polydactyly 1 protein isoform X1, partial [Clarias magur]